LCQFLYDTLLHRAIKYLSSLIFETTLKNRGSKSASLLIAGFAAFTYYKYSKITPEERSSIFDSLQVKGGKIVENYVPAYNPFVE
jgi:hypothetical protein